MFLDAKQGDSHHPAIPERCVDEGEGGDQELVEADDVTAVDAVYLRKVSVNPNFLFVIINPVYHGFLIEEGEGRAGV